MCCNLCLLHCVVVVISIYLFVESFVVCRGTCPLAQECHSMDRAICFDDLSVNTMYFFMKGRWYKLRFQRDSNPWPPRYRCDAATNLAGNRSGASSIYTRYMKRMTWCVYDKDYMSALRIKNISESDLRSASDFFLGFICSFITARITLTYILYPQCAHVIFII